MIAEIIGPLGRVHYRRPLSDPMVEEARRTPGYSVRIVEREPHEMRGGPTEADPERPYCKPDQSCCDFCCGN
jgi:hypothetical protein